MTAITYNITIFQQGNHCAVPIPEEVLQRLGAGRRPLVKVTLNGYTYRSAVATMDGMTLISFSTANRAASGVRGGDTVSVTVEIDTEPRTAEPPADLLAALQAVNAVTAFEKSAPSMQREYARQVEEAKSEETRVRRIAKIVEKLTNS